MIKLAANLLSYVVFITVCEANDWDTYPIPVDPGVGMQWELQSGSDDFNYTAAANGKSAEFDQYWVDKYPNPWQGPGLTDWEPDFSSVANGYLSINVARKPGSQEIYAGVISSKNRYQYPLYIEGRVKINKLVMASAFWLISLDQTEEIDMMEGYGSDRSNQTWYSERMHISHHVFIRQPFQDYQPTDSGSWYRCPDGVKWANDFHTYGVYWRDPWHLEYYINGQLVRTVRGESIIDPVNHTFGTGLSKPMHIVIDTEDQDWRSNNGITPTDTELLDPNKNTMLVDWVRIYKPVAKSLKSIAVKQSNQLQLRFSNAQPEKYYNILKSENLNLSYENWLPVSEQYQSDQLGGITMDVPVTKQKEFFAITETDTPYTAEFTWDAYSGNWWVGYNQSQTKNGVTLVSGGRSASHDGGDGLGGDSGFAFKANYPQDAEAGTFRVEVNGSPRLFQLYSISMKADEGSQPGSVTLTGMLNGIQQWSIDPQNTTSFQEYTSATSGNFDAVIDELVWNGPQQTIQDPGGSITGNQIDRMRVILR